MLNKTELTEEQLIESFRICNYEPTKKNPCRNCPANESDICVAEKGHYIERRIYQLILKQKAEIERLKEDKSFTTRKMMENKAKAVELQKQDIIKDTTKEIIEELDLFFKGTTFNQSKWFVKVGEKLFEIAKRNGVEVE